MATQEALARMKTARKRKTLVRRRQALQMPRTIRTQKARSKKRKRKRRV